MSVDSLDSRLTEIDATTLSFMCDDVAYTKSLMKRVIEAGLKMNIHDVVRIWELDSNRFIRISIDKFSG